MKMALQNDNWKFCFKTVEKTTFGIFEMDVWNLSSFVPWFLNKTQFLKDLLTAVLPIYLSAIW